MDEGSALLHHLERRFNRWLCSVVIGNAVVKETTDHCSDDAEKVNNKLLRVSNKSTMSDDKHIALHTPSYPIPIHPHPLQLYEALYNG